MLKSFIDFGYIWYEVNFTAKLIIFNYYKHILFFYSKDPYHKKKLKHITIERIRLKFLKLQF